MTKCLPGPGGPTVCAHAREPGFPISKGHSHCQFAKNHPPGLAESIRRGDERPCLIGRPFSSAAPLVIPPSSPQRVDEEFHAWQDTSTGVFTPCGHPLRRTAPPANRCTRNEHRHGAGYVIPGARSVVAVGPGQHARARILDPCAILATAGASRLARDNHVVVAVHRGSS